MYVGLKITRSNPVIKVYHWLAFSFSKRTGTVRGSVASSYAYKTLVCTTINSAGRFGEKVCVVRDLFSLENGTPWHGEMDWNLIRWCGCKTIRWLWNCSRPHSSTKCTGRHEVLYFAGTFCTVSDQIHVLCKPPDVFFQLFAAGKQFSTVTSFRLGTLRPLIA